MWPQSDLNHSMIDLVYSQSQSVATPRSGTIPSGIEHRHGTNFFMTIYLSNSWSSIAGSHVISGWYFPQAETHPAFPTDHRLHTHTHTHTYIYIHIYIYIHDSSILYVYKCFSCMIMITHPYRSMSANITYWQVDLRGLRSWFIGNRTIILSDLGWFFLDMRCFLSEMG